MPFPLFLRPGSRARGAGRLPLRAALAALLLPFLAAPALAALGGDAASIEADRAAMQGSPVKTANGAGYTVRETTLPSGTVVREFALPSGTVFAVAWNGPFLPDLQRLLGASFATYADSVRDQADMHGQRVVQRSDLVVRSAGRMRAFTGQAYLPAQLPAGARLDDIR